MINVVAKFVVYCHTNTQNQKSYVGWTTIKCSDQTPVDSMIRRFDEHRNLSRRGSQTHFHNALRKYDISDWKHEILEVMSTPQGGKSAEMLWIALKNSYVCGYNMTIGGDGVSGYKHTDESRKKNSLAHKGLIRSDEHKRRNRISNTGKKRSQRTSINIGNSKRGSLNPWWKKQLPSSMRMKIRFNQPTRRAVKQFTKDLNLIKIFESMADAERATNVPTTNIVKACQGKLKTAGKFVWRYVDDLNESSEQNI